MYDEDDEDEDEWADDPDESLPDKHRYCCHCGADITEGKEHDLECPFA